MPAGRFARCAVSVWVAFACGCNADPTPIGVPWTVVPRDGDERVVLLSEALAARDAGQRLDAEFALAVPGPRSVEWQLTSVGCNCYEVQHDRRTMAVGDCFEIPAGGATRVRIVSQPSVQPGIRQYHADFECDDANGSPYSVPLTHAVRTLADVSVRPDVLQIDLKPGTDDTADCIPIVIEQHVRTASPDEVSVAWNELPSGLTATTPVRDDRPTEVSPGLWRLRWQTALNVHLRDNPLVESPQQLPVVSRLRDREIARTRCTLLARRRSGISAPRLVHFGRLSRPSAAVRRIQLRALDDLPFSVASVASRDGAVEAVVAPQPPAPEHWIEVRALGTDASIDDVLTIATDHPRCPSLQIAIKGVGGSHAGEQQ